MDEPIERQDEEFEIQAPEDELPDLVDEVEEE